MRISKAPAERRAELVAAARELFDERGVEQTRVSDIVKRVGVAQGVFYYYFKSKNEIVDVVVADIVQEVTTRRDAILESPAPFAARLAAYLALYNDWVDGLLADDAKTMVSLREGLLGHNPLVVTGRALLAEGFVTLIENAVDKGEAALPYPAQSAKALLYGIEGLGSEQLPGTAVVYALAEQAFGLPQGAIAGAKDM